MWLVSSEPFNQTRCYFTHPFPYDPLYVIYSKLNWGIDLNINVSKKSTNDKIKRSTKFKMLSE